MFVIPSNMHEHKHARSNYGSVSSASPSSIFGTAPSPPSSASSSPPTNSLPLDLPTIAGMGWPPGAFHRFRWCYVNEGNFCKADATTVTASPTTGAVKSCSWCSIPMP